MIWLRLGGAALFAGVLLGALLAHALPGRLEPRQLQAFETAVRYLLFHGLGLLVIGILVRQPIGAPEATGWAGALMTAGVVLFSGSICWLALGGPRWLGPVTPIGGTLLLAAWATLFVGLLRSG